MCDACCKCSKKITTKNTNELFRMPDESFSHSNINNYGRDEEHIEIYSGGIWIVRQLTRKYVIFVSIKLIPKMNNIQGNALNKIVQRHNYVDGSRWRMECSIVRIMWTSDRWHSLLMENRLLLQRESVLKYQFQYKWYVICGTMLGPTSHCVNSVIWVLNKGICQSFDASNEWHERKIAQKKGKEKPKK